MAVPGPHPVVLVHGAWHGAWCFATLQAALDQRGVPSYAIDLPGHGTSTAALGDLHGDAHAVADALAVIGQAAVLVGHSYGGAVVTQAACFHPDVVHLVYLAAFALDEGESVASFLGTVQPRQTLLGAIVRPAGEGVTDVDIDGAPAAFYADCPPEAVAAALPRLGRQRASGFTQPVSGVPRATIPSTYVRCTRDQAVHPDHQAAMASRCAQTVDFECDHSPFLSRVDDTAELLSRLARG